MSAEIPEELFYTENHEWFNPEDGWMGITDFAQEELGDIVFVELPPAGEKTEAGDELMSVESMKAVSEVYAPVTGEVKEVNGEIRDNPQYVNEAPYGRGKLVRIEPEEAPEGLMDASGYQDFLEEQ